MKKRWIGFSILLGFFLLFIYQLEIAYISFWIGRYSKKYIVKEIEKDGQ